MLSHAAPNDTESDVLTVLTDLDNALELDSEFSQLQMMPNPNYCQINNQELTNKQIYQQTNMSTIDVNNNPLSCSTNSERSSNSIQESSKKKPKRVTFNQTTEISNFETFNSRKTEVNL